MLLATNGGLGTVLTLVGLAYGIVTLAGPAGSHRQRDAQAFRRRATRCDLPVDEGFFQLAEGFRPVAVLCPGGSDAAPAPTTASPTPAAHAVVFLAGVMPIARTPHPVDRGRSRG